MVPSQKSCLPPLSALTLCGLCTICQLGQPYLTTFLLRPKRSQEAQGCSQAQLSSFAGPYPTGQMSVTPCVSTSLGDTGVWGAEARTTPELAFLPGGHLQTSLAIYSSESSPKHQTGVVPEGLGSRDLMVSKPCPASPSRGWEHQQLYKRTPKSESWELPSALCHPHTSGLSCQSKLRLCLLPLGALGQSWAT